VIQRKELAAFLRSRREATDPVSVGIEPGPRRRTPGLRREELAQLAGVSHTWYTWIEQARDISVSRQVLESLARALLLGDVDRAHLFTLAGQALPAERSRHPEVSDTVRRLLDVLRPNPAYVVNDWWDLLAFNDAYDLLAGGDLAARPAGERNILWLMFSDERLRAVFADWATEARQLTGQLRSQAARHPNDPRGAELVEVLRATGRPFTDFWDEQHVERFHPSRKRFVHPQLGFLTLDYVKFAAADAEHQHLLVLLPADKETKASLRSAFTP
jgi:transcriptional regulator with XRE-family HTH domain